MTADDHRRLPSANVSVQRRQINIPLIGPQDVEAVEPVQRTEPWYEYRLADGTEIRLRVVVTAIFRVPGQYDQEGNPLYAVESTNVLQVTAPDELRRPQ